MMLTAVSGISHLFPITGGYELLGLDKQGLKVRDAGQTVLDTPGHTSHCSITLVLHTTGIQDTVVYIMFT